MVGDLKNGRTTHSLARLLTRYTCNIRYVAPAGLSMPQEIVDYVTAKGIPQVLMLLLCTVLGQNVFRELVSTDYTCEINFAMCITVVDLGNLEGYFKSNQSNQIYL